MRTILALAAALLLAGQAQAATLADLAWLQGGWREEKPGRVVSETWLAPEGGVMPGVGRTIRPGRTEVEYMRIDEAEGTLVFIALVAGQPPTAFPAISVTAEGVVFENPAHDFPQRVIYRRCGVQLCARIEGMVDGKVRGMDWRYDRVP